MGETRFCKFHLVGLKVSPVSNYLQQTDLIADKQASADNGYFDCTLSTAPFGSQGVFMLTA